MISPILANSYLHYMLDLGFERVVKPHGRGQAMLVRDANDSVCAFQYRSDADALFRTLPKRLEKFGLQVAPEKTKRLCFSRFHPGMQHRFSVLGFAFHWSTERKKQNRAI